MKKRSLIIFTLGLFVLLALVIDSHGTPIQPSQNISLLTKNQKISITGIVTSESSSSSSKILVIDNLLKISCSCPLSTSYKNKNVTILAIVNEYNNNKKLIALKITDNSQNSAENQ